ncbi:MAG: hypothetical protein KJO46_09445 [Gammaproteobacteria bacterium]|nr:hypothetical protein [Gammaproteobacteria bacterium]
MLRLTGILTGSALTIALIVFMMGIPQLTQPAGDQIATPQADPTPEPYIRRDEAPVPDAVVAEAVAGPEALSEVQETSALESRWYAFWSPFRSEIAADGFVSELQRTTGLDYRVVKLKPGVYEVAFAYSSDADREQKLSRIAAATGLDISGG